MRVVVYIFVLLLLLPRSANAQLSPGELASAHAHLEGLANCTQCHSIGNKIPDSKCLSCHTEIDALIQSDRGFHAWKTTREKTCVDCHSDHHGLKFDMTRFDEKNFDHNTTGYELNGKHATIDCRQCHKPDNIINPEISKRKNTFLGLEKECLSCHDDFHQGTLTNDCVKCHDFESFRPASLFDHNTTDFVLKGAHEDLDCKSCHKEEERNGRTFQLFSNLDFADCIACHENPHKSNWNATCATCHIESSFNTFIGQNSFDHKRTSFTLNGQHANLNCFDCHTKTTADQLFMDYQNVAENNCVQCHQDPHEGKFGENCADCHNEESFFNLNNLEAFNHDLTNFRLIGLHKTVDCKSCHLDKLTKPLAHQNCYDCHEDYHRGEFLEQGVLRDCNECHALEKNFTYSSFGLEEHDASNFPLEGAHIATPCIDCHWMAEQWTFRSIGLACVDCHEDIHQHFISDDYYPQQNCLNCHNSASWHDITFDHEKTSFQLSGKHLEVTCGACHIEKSEDETLILAQNFINLSSECYSCHDNPHGSQFEINGTVDCKRCHSSFGWKANDFNHDKTAFPLEGKHAVINCDACHNDFDEKDGIRIINYKIENFACIDCHQ